MNPSSAQYFIGVDTGTQSTKTILFNSDTGVIVNTAIKNYNLLKGLPPDHKEQDPMIWVDAFLETVRKILEQSHINPRVVQGIGISRQQHTRARYRSCGAILTIKVKQPVFRK